MSEARKTTQQANALLRAATPGPWHHGGHGLVLATPDASTAREVQIARVLAENPAVASDPKRPVADVRDANAELIARAPELIAELCSEVRSIQDALVRVCSALATLTSMGQLELVPDFATIERELLELLECAPSIQAQMRALLQEAPAHRIAHAVSQVSPDALLEIARQSSDPRRTTLAFLDIIESQKRG
jgi:hypothetical protein